MNLPKRRLLARLYRRPEPGDDGSGAAATPSPAPAPAAETAASPSPAAPTPAPAPAETAATPAPAGDAAATPAADAGAPKTLLEAIQSASKPKPTDAPKPVILGADGKPIVEDPAKKPDAAAKPDDKAEKPDDITAMPDGLAPKAQERFQKLVATNKDLTTEVGTLRETREYFAGQLREHNISQPQFELATKTVGMINRGDFQGAMKVLQDQMQQIAVLAGTSVPAIDVLTQHPDLRSAVDNLQISEAQANELAQARATQANAQRAQQRQESQRQAAQTQQVQTQQQQVAVQQGLSAVDQKADQLRRTDLDYARIEAILLPQINELIGHLPPAQWPAAFERQYNLIKAAGAPQRTAGPSVGTLRPGAADNPQTQPKTMFEAIFGASRSA